MKHTLCFLGVVSVTTICGQNVLWTDTFKYSINTQILGMVPLDSENTVVYGTFDEGYAGNWENARTFLLKVGKDGLFSFLDSSTTGGGKGPVRCGTGMYSALILGPKPMIGSTHYPSGTYLVKYDLNGQVVWANKQEFHGIPTDIGSDGTERIYVLYNTLSGPMFCCYNKDGTQIFHPFPWGAKPAFDSQNNLYVTGASQIRKFDYSGNLLWSRYTSNDAQLQIDGDGNSFVLSGGISAYDANGNLLWTNPFPKTCYGRIRVEGANIYFVYTTGSANDHGSPNVVSKLDSKTGTVIWSKQVPFPSSKPYFPSSITSNNGIVYFSACEPEPNSSIIVAIEDLSYIPVTTSLPDFEKKTAAFGVVPNPSGGVLRVISDGNLSPAEIRVTDAMGRQVYYREAQSFRHEETLDLSHLSPGVYFVEMVTGSGESIIKRIVLQ